MPDPQVSPPGAEARLPIETGPDAEVRPRSFYGVPPCADLTKLDAQVAFLGIPYDLGAGVAGARFAPDALRDTRMYNYGSGARSAGGYYDIDAARQRLVGVTMADCGDVGIIRSDVERNFWRVTRVVREIVRRGSLLVAVGGDHAITPAVVRGYEGKGPIDIVHFDAHHDYLDHHQGVRWTNGMAIRRSSEFPWVRHITQIGLRNFGPSGSAIEDSLARGNRILTTEQFRALGPDAAMAQVPESDALYVSFDVDILDPSVCPGTGAPVPGGLTYLEMRSALRALARRGRVVGLDVVEVCPPLDLSGLTSVTVSHLIVDFLSAIFDR